MNIVRQAVLEAGVLELGSYHFSGDEPAAPPANNKLNFDRLFMCPDELRIVVHHLGRVVHSAGPDALIGIKSGGEKLAEEINNRPEFPALPLIRLDKDPEQSTVQKKSFVPSTPEDIELLNEAESIVIVEDVFNKFTNTLGVLAVKGVLEKTRLAVAVWDRGLHPSRLPLPVPSKALVAEHIWRVLRPADDLFYYGRHQEEER